MCEFRARSELNDRAACLTIQLAPPSCEALSSATLATELLQMLTELPLKPKRVDDILGQEDQWANAQKGNGTRSIRLIRHMPKQRRLCALVALQ